MGARRYRLTESLPYLMNRLGVRLGELFSRTLAPYGVTLPMYRVMAALWERDGRRLGELAEVTSVELSTLSRLVGVLVRKGLVSRTRPAGNARTVEIALTPAGLRLVEQLIPLAQHYDAVASAAFGPGTAHLKDALREAYASLDSLEQQLGPAPAQRLRRPRRPSARARDAS